MKGVRAVAKRVGVVLLSLTASLSSLALFGACSDDDAGSAPYVALQELDQTQQPTTQALGVLVDVVASGGNVVRLDAVGGTFVGTSSSVLCLVFPPGGGSSASSAVVGVLPAQTEALLTADLGNVGDVGVPVHLDATVDAAGTDGAGAGSTSAPAGASAASPSLLFDPGCATTDFVPETQSVTIVVSVGRAPPPLSSGTPDGASVSEAGEEAGEGGDGEAEGGDAASGDGGDAQPPNDGAPSDAAADVTDSSGGNG
ncbi:MAG TPA: hypothetical protein VIY73_14690 [Polyangiaceae bacterium]